MIASLGFDCDTRTGIPAADDRSTRTSAAAVMFRHLVRSLLSCASPEKSDLRQVVKSRLVAAREPFARIDELLDVCVSASTPERLDSAIDVLAETEDLVLRYAWDYLIADVRQWNPYSGRAYEPSDDHWYILLKAVARCSAPVESRVRFVLACAGASERGILEGVVEALGELGTERCRAKLRSMAQSSPDPFIRRLASDVLHDTE